MTLHEKYLRFKEYLDNGGLEKIFSIDLLEDLKKVRIDSNKQVMPETITPLVMAAFNAIAGSHYIEPYISDTYIQDYKSLNQKDLYFTQQKIDTIEEFDEIYEKFKDTENILFRGVSEAKWRLLNSLQRFWIKEKYASNKIDYFEFIQKMIENARSIYNDSIKRYLAELRLDYENDIAVLSFLQHYGSNSFTPLLDWSYKFKHSLFFAIDNLNVYNPQSTELDEYFSVYYLDEKLFQDVDISEMVKKILDEKSEEIYASITNGFKDVPEDKLISLNNAMTDGSKKYLAYYSEGKGTIRHMTKIYNLKNFPTAFFSDKNLEGPFRYSILNNFNIINQQGAFIWNNNPTKPLEYIVKEEYLKENTEPFSFSYCLNIKKKLKYHIRNRLDQDKVTRKFIYPNPDDIANDAFLMTIKNYCP